MFSFPLLSYFTPFSYIFRSLPVLRMGHSRVCLCFAYHNNKSKSNLAKGKIDRLRYRECSNVCDVRVICEIVCAARTLIKTV